jgi:hypothetical protein
MDPAVPSTALAGCGRGRDGRGCGGRAMPHESAVVRGVEDVPWERHVKSTDP